MLWLFRPRWIISSIVLGILITKLTVGAVDYHPVCAAVQDAAPWQRIGDNLCNSLPPMPSDKVVSDCHVLAESWPSTLADWCPRE